MAGWDACYLSCTQLQHGLDKCYTSNFSEALVYIVFLILIIL